MAAAYLPGHGEEGGRMVAHCLAQALRVVVLQAQTCTNSNDLVKCLQVQLQGLH
jgi:hypothetical protein